MTIIPLLLLSVYSVFGDLQGNSTSSSNWFKDALEDLKNILEDGETSLNIPSFDPLNINKNLTWSNSTSYFAFNGSISGYSNYTVNSAYLNSSLDSVSNLTFSQVTVDGQYVVNTSYRGILPIQGSGNISTVINGLEVNINASLAPGGGVVRFTDFKLAYDCNSSVVNLSGLLNEFITGNTLSDIIEDVLPNLIQKYNDVLGVIVSNVVQTRGTSYLETLNLDRIIEIAKKSF